jgi:hypothetical protein
VSSAAGAARPPILLWVLAGAFVLLIAAILIGALVKPEFPPYALTVARPAPVGDSLVGPATYTLDASDGDRWQHFDFARNAVVADGKWDIAFRRFRVLAGPGAGIADLGLVHFDSVRALPDTGYRENLAGPDTANPGVGKWYDYSMLTHLLTSRGHVYALRTADGRYAKVALLAYYCRDVGTACLTFRYAYQGGRSRRVEK